MTQTYDLAGMIRKIEILRRTTEELRSISGGIPTVERNAERILAVVRLLELDFCDVAELQ